MSVVRAGRRRRPAAELNREAESLDVDRLFRKLATGSIALLVVGAILFVSGLAMPSTIPSSVPALGLVALIGALALRAVLLVDRIWGFLVGRSPRHRSVLAPPTYTCHKCGYKLRGVKGAFCPECGTVRPVAVNGNDSA